MNSFVSSLAIGLGVLLLGAGCKPPGKPTEADIELRPEEVRDFAILYKLNCAGCHGGLDRKPVQFGSSFYPPAPQLILHPPDDPEWHTFYVVHNGVRYTGMPAWEKNLSEEDIWKVTGFLSHIEKLPQGAQEYWKNAVGVAPPTGGADEHVEHDKH